MHAPRLQIPRDATHEAHVIAGDDNAVRDYARWLGDQKHPLGELVAADLAAELEPPRQRKAKKHAKACFEAYRRDVLSKAFPLLAQHMTHFLDGQYYASLRYGFVEKLDTFRLNKPAERDEALALLADPHGMFVRHVALRNAAFDTFDRFASLRGLRRLNFRWTDISKVDSLAPLAELGQLRALNINGSKVSDLSPLAGLPLIQLYCSKTEVVDLSPLAGHPTLSHIALDATKVQDIGPLLECPKLCRVELWDTPLPDTQLRALARYLDEAANEPVNDDALLDGYERYLSHRDI
ncbi:MAG: hypothetical protein KC503_20010 [Myxococcales bacterium]|nr:hypothetical protein [Myxococcales bacterium]